ncbi:hypothetical protein BJ912DRAFT_965312 [Pholiota molesta]|nr:hypothetical protein BJ912DRAFT_965312 [Pholiota molesta]
MLRLVIRNAQYNTKPGPPAHWEPYSCFHITAMVVISESNEPANKLKSESEIPSSDSSVRSTPDYSQVASQSEPIYAQGSPRRPLPDIKPSNFVALFRSNSSISGEWIIEPALLIPPTMLPPLSGNETEETRRNLSLESHSGSVDAEIFIMPHNNEASSQVQQQRNRVFIETSSRNGSVTTKVHDVPSTNPNQPAFRFNGRVTLYLPRSFKGLVNLKTGNGSIRLSSAMKASETQFSDVDRTKRSFIGDFDPSEWMDDAKWTGDQLYVEAKSGNINVHFDDEVDPPKPRSPDFLKECTKDFSDFSTP